MATKLGMMVTYLDGLLAIKSHDFSSRGLKITWQPKIIIFPLPQCLWPTNLASWWLVMRGSIQNVTPTFDHVVLRDHVTNWNHYISIIRVPMAIKINMIVTSLDGLLPVKSHKPLITWSSKITWQTKIIIFSLQQCLWPLNFARW